MLFWQRLDTGYAEATSMRYTEEQLAAVQAFRELKSLKIKALAGTGKTTTLLAMAEQDHRKGLYLAYNREISSSSSSKFPSSVVCKTAHAMAFSQLSPELKEKTQRGLFLRNDQLARFLNRRVGFSEAESRRYATPIKEALHWFCVSADPHPSAEHLAKAIEMASFDIDPDKLLLAIPAVWESVTAAGGELPLGFDAYLKLFQLSGAALPFDYVLADEGQDMFPAIQLIIRNSGAQQIWVGDPNQQIYEFNGAENAMRQLDELDEYPLTLAFRFGEWLAELVAPLLRQLGETAVLQGNPRVNTRRGGRSQRVRIARGNATLLGSLVKAAKQERKVHVLGGTNKLQGILLSAEQLIKKRGAGVGLFSGLWSWQEAREKAVKPGNHALRAVVELIDEHGLGNIQECVQSSCGDEEDAQTVLSTVHQAKGQEYPGVAILDDFRRKPEYVATYGGRDFFAPPSDMVRLLYVALTRAEYELFVPMSLARRFGIDTELTADRCRRPRRTEVAVEEPPTVEKDEPPPLLWPRPHPIELRPISSSNLIRAPQLKQAEVRESPWDQWGLRLIVLVGILANLAMLDYKGYIDLVSVTEYLGEHLRFGR